MTLKEAMLRVVEFGTLRTIWKGMGIPIGAAAGRTREEMTSELARAEEATAEAMIDYLSDAELRVACEEYGLSLQGGPPGLLKAILKEEALSGPAGGRRVPGTFVAIDFETADRGPDSACAVGLVRVEGGRVARRSAHLLRPPRREFEFTYLHGISWEQVARERTFGEVWPRLSSILEGAEFLAAHNARFDRSVLNACCAAFGLDPPGLPFECTVDLSRRTWNIRPTKLPDVCSHLGIGLDHHDPLSDAEACARIVIAALRDGGTVRSRDGRPARPRPRFPRGK